VMLAWKPQVGSRFRDLRAGLQLPPIGPEFRSP
jgi:hypothetical protein